MSARPEAGFREAVWRAHGASAEEAAELAAYAASPPAAGALPARRYPLADAPAVAHWQRYAREAEEAGAFPALRRVLVQLRFPVAAGMSQAPAYLAATRRGELPPEAAPGLELARPEDLRVFLHDTPTGRVPVVLAGARQDFETLVRALTLRNEPEPVPASMGACMIAGYNNWDRVRAHRRAWEAERPGLATEAGWLAAFRELVPRKDLYQDRFILLSAGPYSSTPAAELGLDPAAWRAASVTLRLEHECTHYFVREAFGTMRKSLLDELVADYMGLVEATGGFRADWFLRFMGLESHPRYREGGRLQNYRGVPPLSEGAWRVLPGVVERAAAALARLDPSRGRGPLHVIEKARVITGLMTVGLEALASDEAAPLLAAALAEAARSVPRAGPEPPLRHPEASAEA